MTHGELIQRAALPAGITLAYEAFGDAGDPPLLLIAGLGTQMLGWPDGFCTELVGRGHHVIRFDNRDVGLSTHVSDGPTPNPIAAYAGDLSSASYTLSDMAADTAALLDALELGSAHVVGASMGAMIAQTLAVEHPRRVRSLTSIMSSTGDRGVGQPTEAALGALLAPAARTRAEAIERAVAGYRVIASPGFEPDEASVRARAGRSFDRAHDPLGVARQLVAILASGDRTARLAAVQAPTLVVHGAADPLVQPDGGRATAAAIPGAELLLVDGMGHDLPRDLWPVIAGRIAALVARAEARVADRRRVA